MRDIELRPILENRAKCNLIRFVDIRPTRSQMCDMSEHMVLDIIKILIDNHPGFEYLASSPAFKHHSYRLPPSQSKTREYVLRTTTNDESTTDGNIKVARNAYLLEQLGFGLHDLDNQANGIDHGNHCMTDIGAVGGKHNLKSIRQIPWKIQRFDDPVEHFLRKSCREEGDKNIDRELQQYFSELAICCAECVCALQENITL